MPLCPYAREVKGTIVVCGLLRRKVSSLKYPCKGKYQACPIYRARAPRLAAAPTRQAEEKPSQAGEASPPQESRVEERAEEAPVPQEGVAEQPRATAAPEEARPASGAAPGERGAAILKGSGIVCEALFQANILINAVSSEDFRGRIEEVARRSSAEENIVYYLAGNVDATGDRIRFVAFRGQILGVELETSEGKLCGEDAAQRVKPDTEVRGLLYKVDIDSLGGYREQVLEAWGSG